MPCEFCSDFTPGRQCSPTETVAANQASERVDVRSINWVDARRVKMTAMSIVNHTLETAGLAPEKRQAINDTCDDFAVSALMELLSASTAAICDGGGGKR